VFAVANLQWSIDKIWIGNWLSLDLVMVIGGSSEVHVWCESLIEYIGPPDCVQCGVGNKI
jgi:hypothetical protein